MFFHFLHASSLFSYYFSKFRPNYKLVGCPMLMMGLASTSLLSEGSRRSFGMFCCLSVWGQIHERQTARGCVRYFCLVYFFCICICKPLLRWRQINERRPDRACICPVEDDISSRPREDNKAFDRCICICFIDISLFFGICKSCCWVTYLVDQEKTTRLLTYVFVFVL